MKESIDILIREDGLSISSSFKQGEVEFIIQPVSDLASSLLRYCTPKNPAALNVFFYIAEDLLFFKKFTLPLKTTDIKEAISYQLAMFAPFEGKMVHGYTAVRTKQSYNICLYAALEETLVPLLDEVSAQGFQVAGLFPESQRYVTRLGRKKDWALLLPSRFPKLLLFSDNNITERLLCHSEPSLEELQTLKVGEVIYRPGPAAEGGFQDAAILLAEKPLHKVFNLLPPSYRRPDYLRHALIALFLLNLCALLAAGGIKEYNVSTLLKKIDVELATLRPAVKEVEALTAEEKQLSSTVDRIEGIGENFDIIRFLEKITKSLPEKSYLDQIRMDEKTGDIQLQGYAEDIGELTGKLEALGNAKLKSTSRRKNQTYFDVEMSKP
ncbi:MAG: PilN domain-containing protein [Deltaproteobacteria bacterium]|nr:PilN domain-containing protein [Deltaproteobacteria bacterium]